MAIWWVWYSSFNRTNVVVVVVVVNWEVVNRRQPTVATDNGNRRQRSPKIVNLRQPTVATDRGNRPWQPIMITNVEDHPESIPMVELFMRDLLLMRRSKIDDIDINDEKQNLTLLLAMVTTARHSTQQTTTYDKLLTHCWKNDYWNVKYHCWV